MTQFDDWMPTRVFWQEGAPSMEWMLVGRRRFTRPFFEDTIQELLRHPFHHAFRRHTPLDELDSIAAANGSAPPKGFIFHMSRCGSTLLAQSLAAVDRHIVLSEPPPVDSILRSHFRDARITTAQRARWLRSLLTVMGRMREDVEDGLFVKFDCWSIAEIAVVRSAFPDVPWIFLYRDPIEVLVSQLRQPSLWAVPGSLSPAVLGIEPAELAGIPRDEHCARLLGRICQIAHDSFLSETGGLLVNYLELPQFCYTGMLRHFGLHLTSSEIETIRQTGQNYSKTPGLQFEPDAESKRQSASAREKELAEEWIAPHVAQLETRRTLAHAAARI